MNNGEKQTPEVSVRILLKFPTHSFGLGFEKLYKTVCKKAIKVSLKYPVTILVAGYFMF